MSTTPTFNYVQTVFSLNMFSNLVSDMKDTDQNLQADLTNMLSHIFADPDVQNMIGQWEVVWGPVVGSYGADDRNFDKAVVSNAMYVAYNAVNNQYVIATSATNPISKYGWFVEDFDVRTMQLWSNVTGLPEVFPQTMISNGTYTGISKLKSMQWNNGSTTQTLVEFLTSTFATSNTPTQLVVTGHSLGGAMSSVLGLYLAEISSQWNTANMVQISSMPTAGATPGNQAFSNHHSQVMGMRTVRFWNKLDPVPHGWQPDLVQQVPFLYYPFLKPGALFMGLVGLVLEQSYKGTLLYPQGGFYTQLMPQVSPLPGQIDIVNAANPPASAVLQFMVDLGIDELFTIIKIPKLLQSVIIDVINVLMKKFVNEETIDQFMDKLRADLAKLPAKEEWIEKLFTVLESIVYEFENVFLFLVQLASQHVTSYPYMMGTSAMHPLTQAIINNMVELKGLNNSYTNIVEKQSNPQFIAQQMAPTIGSVLLSLLTPEFLAKKGWDIL